MHSVRESMHERPRRPEFNFFCQVLKWSTCSYISLRTCARGRVGHQNAGLLLQGCLLAPHGQSEEGQESGMQ